MHQFIPKLLGQKTTARPARAQEAIQEHTGRLGAVRNCRARKSRIGGADFDYESGGGGSQHWKVEAID
jgi:hypothetical protein